MIDAACAFEINEPHGSAIVLDDAGNAYVTGRTSASDFPTTPGAFDTAISPGPDDGFLTKDQAPDRLVSVIQGVVAGEAALSRRMVGHLVRDVRAGQRRISIASRLPHRERLTPRQLEVLQLIAAGCTTSEIAGDLSLSPETVRWHVKSILRKLHAKTRAEAAAVLAEIAV